MRAREVPVFRENTRDSRRRFDTGFSKNVVMMETI